MLTKYEWEQEQYLFYDVMPDWWWSKLNRHKAYKNYLEEYGKWQEKRKVGWGSTTIDME
jgi:hypothetical protein|tara:strand:- start:648 stop:824 length:177 start_codon:yes stop_codon:yes gene_type:complete